MRSLPRCRVLSAQHPSRASTPLTSAGHNVEAAKLRVLDGDHCAAARAAAILVGESLRKCHSRARTRAAPADQPIRRASPSWFPFTAHHMRPATKSPASLPSLCSRLPPQPAPHCYLTCFLHTLFTRTSRHHLRSQALRPPPTCRLLVFTSRAVFTICMWCVVRKAGAALALPWQVSFWRVTRAYDPVDRFIIMASQTFLCVFNVGLVALAVNARPPPARPAPPHPAAPVIRIRGGRRALPRLGLCTSLWRPRACLGPASDSSGRRALRAQAGTQTQNQGTGEGGGGGQAGVDNGSARSDERLSPDRCGWAAWARGGAAQLARLRAR